MRKRKWREGVAIGGKDEDGRQRFACSLDAVAEPCAPEPATTAWVDWERIPALAGFNRRERAVWLFCWEHQQSGTVALGLTPHQIAAINAEILRKLRRNLPALQGSIGYLTDPEQTLTENLQGTRAKSAFLNCSSRSIALDIETLKEKAAAEGAKLARLSERVHQTTLAVDEAESAVIRLEEAMKADQVQAALDEKPWPSRAAEKAIAEARSKLAAALSAQTAARAAIQRQAAIVETVAGEIAGRRHEAFEAELEPAKIRLLDLMREFCEAACEVRQIAHRHGFTDGHLLSAALFPWDARDPIAGFPERASRVGLVNSAIGISDYLAYAFRKAA